MRKMFGKGEAINAEPRGTDNAMERFLGGLTKALSSHSIMSPREYTRERDTMAALNAERPSAEIGSPDDIVLFLESPEQPFDPRLN